MTQWKLAGWESRDEATLERIWKFWKRHQLIWFSPPFICAKCSCQHDRALGKVPLHETCNGLSAQQQLCCTTRASASKTCWTETVCSSYRIDLNAKHPLEMISCRTSTCRARLGKKAHDSISSKWSSCYRENEVYPPFIHSKSTKLPFSAAWTEWKVYTWKHHQEWGWTWSELNIPHPNQYWKLWEGKGCEKHAMRIAKLKVEFGMFRELWKCECGLWISQRCLR